MDLKLRSGHVTQEMEVRQDRSVAEVLPIANEPDLEPRANRDQDRLVLQKKVKMETRDYQTNFINKYISSKDY